MVLFVDDDAAFLKEAVRTLNAAGVQIIPAPDAHKALAAVRTLPAIHVAIVDLDLPDMGGLELIYEIKSLRPGMRVIAITGVLPRYTLEIAQSLGAETVLEKPVTGEWLEAIQRVRQSAAGN